MTLNRSPWTREGFLGDYFSIVRLGIFLEKFKLPFHDFHSTTLRGAIPNFNMFKIPKWSNFAWFIEVPACSNWANPDLVNIFNKKQFCSPGTWYEPKNLYSPAWKNVEIVHPKLQPSRSRRTLGKSTTKATDWWLNHPSEKYICSSNRIISSQNRGEHEKIFETST